jgi:hypothetical protein
MNATGTITMTMREVDRFKVIQAVTEARLKPGQAAGRLGLSVRQVERLVLRYQAAGVAGLVSGKRGRPGMTFAGTPSRCKTVGQNGHSTAAY